MTDHNHFQGIEWLGMGFRVPRHWEIVRHSVNPEKGHLAFVDRRHQRLLWSWAASPAIPDTRQLLADYQARDLETSETCRFESLEPTSSWRGYRCLDSSPEKTRAVRYDHGAGRWVEITLTWPEGLERQCEQQILDSFRMQAPAEPQHWQAFQLSVTAPAGWTLERARVKPADVSFRFGHGRQKALVRRRGMADVWFDGDLRAFLRQHVPERIQDVETRTCASREAVFGTSREPGTRLKRVLKRLRRRKDLVWLDSEARALIQVTTLAPQQDPLEPDMFEAETANQGTGSAPQPGRQATQEESGLTWAGVLDAVPMHNQAARTEASDKDATVVYVPVRKRWFNGPPFTWLLPLRNEKRYVLDPVGAEVWRACDGRTTVEAIVEGFARRHRVTFHEARVQVLQFMKSLMENAMLVAVSQPQARRTAP